MYSTGTIVSNAVITLNGDRWLLYFYGDYFIRHINVESLYCTPETHTIFYAN